MSTVTVYAYTLFAMSGDQLRRERRIATARRMGTLQAIHAAGGFPIAGSGAEIDDCLLSHDRPGFTDPGFRPAEPEAETQAA